jgi:hypothetical protein
MEQLINPQQYINILEDRLKGQLSEEDRTRIEKHIDRLKDSTFIYKIENNDDHTN